MNYIKQLNGFFLVAENDERLNCTHVALYMSIFRFWNINRFRNPISISREDLMRISKISSKATYHKCIKQLHEYGYFNYQPSFDSYKGSVVYLFSFQTTSERVQVTSTIKRTGNEQALNTQQTGTEQEVYPYINSINNKNITNKLNEEKKKKKNRKSNLKENLEEQKEKEKFRQKKKKADGNGTAKASATLREPKQKIPPFLEEVQAYFLQQGSTKLNAEKFFNHNTSTGWIVSGKTPMVDWQAAARNWLLNAKSKKHRGNNTSKTPNAGQLNVSNDKDYSEPL